MARALEVRPAVTMASCHDKSTVKIRARPSAVGRLPRVTRCGGEGAHTAFTYHLNQITKGSYKVLDYALSELYNVAAVLRWQPQDGTRYTKVSSIM